VGIHSVLTQWHEQMKAWRRDLHAHPELGFEEHRTSQFVASKLQGWGLEVERGIAGTGVVGTLRGSDPKSKAIALRADMDALPMREENQFAHASGAPGRMHGCGHDGHTVMLLGAAKYLATVAPPAGTVHFIFQPAEEGLGGAQRMLDDRLFSRFECSSVYGLHNWPGLPLGKVGIRQGPMMASMDRVVIDIVGKGGHGGLPHLTVDPVVVAAHVITALQALVSRSIDPLQAAALSITCVTAGTSHNVIPESARLTGTIRSLTPEVRDQLEAGIRRIVSGVAQAFGATAQIDYERQLPALSNTARETQLARCAAATVVGEGNVDEAIDPVLGSEDFACMLQQRPGAYAFLGQADAGHRPMIHSPRYDFNDDLLPIGSSYWIAVVEQEMARSA